MLAVGADLVTVFAHWAGTGYALSMHLAPGSDTGDAVGSGRRQELGREDSLLVIIFPDLLVGPIEEHGQGLGVDRLHPARFEGLIFFRKMIFNHGLMVFSPRTQSFHLEGLKNELYYLLLKKLFHSTSPFCLFCFE